MKLYIAYWSPQNYECKDVKIKEIEAEFNNEKWIYTWKQSQFPEIYPKYCGANFGKEERAYFKKSIHYMVHDDVNILKKKVQTVIDKYIDNYTNKLQRWEEMTIIMEQ